MANDTSKAGQKVEQPIDVVQATIKHLQPTEYENDVTRRLANAVDDVRCVNGSISLNDAIGSVCARLEQSEQEVERLRHAIRDLAETTRAYFVGLETPGSTSDQLREKAACNALAAYDALHANAKTPATLPGKGRVTGV